ncbi:MAG: flagellar biosynthesis anti-sigma factor FlgM [Proteobacteria bacterium]|nr:flagellar biosynthesis anti-sigma factor FlgM [Pseudomonadota bacterium]
MRIDKDVKTNPLDTLTKSAQAKSPKQTATEDKHNMGVSDKVELSGKNIDITKITAKVNAAPSIREDKVNSIRAAIENGTYKVKSELVAKAVIKNTLLDEIL